MGGVTKAADEGGGSAKDAEARETPAGSRSLGNELVLANADSLGSLDSSE